MSVRVSTWVWEHSPAAGNDRLILLAIADVANDEGRQAWPALGTLARKTLLHRRTVERRIAAMESAGWLVVERGAGPGGTHRYTVVMDASAWFSTTPAVSDADGGDDGRVAPDGGRQIAGGGNLPDAAKLAAGGATPGAVGGAAPGAARTSFNVLEPPPPARARGSRSEEEVNGADVDGRRVVVAAAADAVMDRLAPAWRLTAGQRRRLARQVTGPLSAGWSVDDLARDLGANSDGVRAPYAVLAARVADLGPPPTRGSVERPPWCGSCDESTRLAETPNESLARCPTCHPLRASVDAAGGDGA